MTFLGFVEFATQYFPSECQPAGHDPFLTIAGLVLALLGTHMFPSEWYPAGQEPFFGIGIACIVMIYPP